MKEKIIYKLMLLSGVIFLFAGGIYAGYRISQIQTDQRVYCTVNTIAVVNLDEGVLGDSGRINYAAALGELPDVNFVYAGLEEARSGLESNRYAAYILIPASFSDAVTSINQKPEKAPIEYRINTKLKESLSVSIFAQILNYIQTINDNLSYLYMDAVLEEFHSAQDDALTIMKNDNEDMAAISSIQENSLLAPLEFSQMQSVERVITPVDLAQEYEKMDALVEQIGTEYQTGYQKAHEKFMTIKSREQEMVKALSYLEEYIGRIDVGNDASGNPVYQQGLDQLRELMEQAKADSKGARQKVKNLIKWENPGGVPEDPDREKSLYEKIQEKETEIADTNQEIRDSIQEIQSLVGGTVTAVMTPYSAEESNENGQNDSEMDFLEESRETEPAVSSITSKAAPAAAPSALPPVLTSDDMKKIQEELNKIEAGLMQEDALTDLVKDSMDQVVKEVDYIQEFPVDDAVKLVEEEMIDKVEEEIKKEKEQLAEENKKARTQVTDYSRDMQAYDPFSYLDTAEIDSMSGRLGEQTAEIAAEMNNTGREYAEYTNEVYENAAEHTRMLTEDIQSTYEVTEKNVAAMVEQTKNSRGAINRQNVELLQNFTQLLPYTRKGSIADRSVYDFVVDPIEVRGNYEAAGRGMQETPEVVLNRVFLVLILIEGILFAGSVVFYSIQNKTNQVIE